MDFSEGVYRLSCGPDCSIGGSGPPPAVPEPASWALMIGGLGLTGAMMRRRPKVRVSFG